MARYARVMKALTPKQKQVLRMLVLTGKKSNELAELLGMSERTLKFHLGNLTAIFGVSTRAQLQVKVFGDVLSALHQARGGRGFGSNPDQRILKTSRLLSALVSAQDPSKRRARRARKACA